MKPNRMSVMMITTILLSVCAHVCMAENEKSIKLKIGPTWPADLSATAWDAALEYGVLFDRKVMFGGSFDFLWKTVSEEAPGAVPGEILIKKSEKTFMFPLCGTVSLIPVDNLPVTPLVWGSAGLNILYFSHQSDSTATTDSTSVDGWYTGLITKLGIDGEYPLGENTAIFAGMEYQWTKPTKSGSSSGSIDSFYRRNMSGFGIRLGLKANY